MKNNGLTLVEVILAMAVFGIVAAALSFSISSNLNHTSKTGQKSQAVQILNYLGRRVADSDVAVLPASTANPLAWGYGQLSSSFTELNDDEGLVDLSRFKAKVSEVGTVSIDEITMTQYNVEVCYKSGGNKESCIQGITLAADGG